MSLFEDINLESFFEDFFMYFSSKIVGKASFPFSLINFWKIIEDEIFFVLMFKSVFIGPGISL